VLVWAVYTVGLAWRPAGVHPMLMLAAMTAVGLAALLPAYLWEMAQGRQINLHIGSLASLAYVGIFPSFVGYIFYNRGVAEVGPNKASLFIHLMPVFGTLLSFMFLGEIPLWYHYLGIALIFTGIWLTTKK
jgi:drug/metabolite transporter (DMT)-like permease